MSWYIICASGMSDMAAALAFVSNSLFKFVSNVNFMSILFGNFTKPRDTKNNRDTHTHTHKKN